MPIREKVSWEHLLVLQVRCRAYPSLMALPTIRERWHFPRRSKLDIVPMQMRFGGAKEWVSGMNLCRCMLGKIRSEFILKFYALPMVLLCSIRLK